MIAVRDLFRVGIGPSSSHTVGPMKAAHAFIQSLSQSEHTGAIARIKCVLLGSLAWTGSGHWTDQAVTLGLAGCLPDAVDPDAMQRQLASIRNDGALPVAGRYVRFDAATDIVFDRDGAAPVHPNTLSFHAYDADGREIVHERWCSIGGGFIAREEQVGHPAADQDVALPFAFRSAETLLRIGEADGLRIAEIVRANEAARPEGATIDAYLDHIIAMMMACIDRGMTIDGVLPGRLGVRRRAADIRRKLDGESLLNRQVPHAIMDHVSLFAIAVNEENAAGGRVVTAPTNGAAGVVPAVLRYYRDFWPTADREGMRDFLLTASAIGALTKLNASISGAEVGCQGEVGTASAMAAAGLAAVIGGSNAQVENAAEIAMEHHLGMTCDPIAGLVQVPCIERNAFGAIKAINAASLAMRGDGQHLVSLDQVIDTMRETGRDMHDKYKETSRGGLAVSFPEC